MFTKDGIMQTTEKLRAKELLLNILKTSDNVLYVAVKKISRTGASKEVAIHVAHISNGKAMLGDLTLLVAKLLDLPYSKNKTITLKRRLPTDHLEMRLTSDVSAILYGDAQAHTLNFCVI